MAQFPDAVVAGKTGRASSFEVTINDQLIFSKLKMGGFPDANELMNQVANGAEGRPMFPVEKTSSGGCTIL